VATLATIAPNRRRAEQPGDKADSASPHIVRLPVDRAERLSLAIKDARSRNGHDSDDAAIAVSPG
jgi:hypothetical protein